MVLVSYDLSQPRALLMSCLIALSSTSFVAEIVKKLIVPFASRTSSEAHRVVKYAPHFRLAFTLLNEDASSGHAALSWELEKSVHGEGPGVPPFTWQC